MSSLLILESLKDQFAIPDTWHVSMVVPGVLLLYTVCIYTDVLVVLWIIYVPYTVGLFMGHCYT